MDGPACMHYHSFLVSRELGGAALIALRLAKWMFEQGETPHVWAPGEGPAARAAEQEGLPWQSYDLDSMKKGNLAHALGCMRMVPGLLLHHGWAHVHSPVVYRILRPILRLTRLRTAVSVHIEPEPEEIRWAFRDPPDLILPCARFMDAPLRLALGERGQELRIAAAPNGVDTARFFPGDAAGAKTMVGAPKDRPLVLMLANLAPHKGHVTALRAVAELKARGMAVECWLAGIERDGRKEYGQQLRSLVAELGVGGLVRFLGFRRDGPDLLRAADFLLLPSTHEGLPLSIVEAQASKVPVLAAPTAGIPEVIIDGETGFLIPATDASGYADRIALLLQNPGLRQRVVDKALAVVLGEYTLDAYCKRVAELLQGFRAA